MTDAVQPQPDQKASTTNALVQLAASGDNWVKLATIGLIGLTGLGNWAATQSTGQANRAEIDRVVREIHEVYANQDRYVQSLREIDDIDHTIKQNAAQILLLTEQQRYVLQLLHADGKPEEDKR